MGSFGRTEKVSAVTFSEEKMVLRSRCLHLEQAVCSRCAMRDDESAVSVLDSVSFADLFWFGWEELVTLRV